MGPDHVFLCAVHGAPRVIMASLRAFREKHHAAAMAAALEFHAVSRFIIDAAVAQTPSPCTTARVIVDAEVMVTQTSTRLAVAQTSSILLE